MTTSGEGSGGTGPRRRYWTAEEKARIVAECDAPGASVSVVARRYDVNAHLVFTWRRQSRQRPRGAGEVSFVPAIIAPNAPEAARPSAVPREPQPVLEPGAASRPSGRIEIVLGASRRIIVDQDVSAAALARVIGVLER